MKRLYYNRHLNEGFNIHAIKSTFTPASVSALTMFSKLYDENGNEI